MITFLLWGLAVVFGLLLLIGLLFVIRAVALSLRLDDPDRRGKLDILKELFRKGEISWDQYRKKKRDLD